MRLRILVTRPREDGEEIARHLAAMGHHILLAPLLTVKFLEGSPPDLHGVQAVLITSANGARGLARRTPNRNAAIFAVGPQTAAAAREAGFLRVQSAAGDAATLARAVARWAGPAAGILLHVAGEDANNALCERLTAHGFQTRRENLYRMEKAARLSDEAAQAIRQGEVDAALFFSPNSAALFAECAARESLPTDRVIAICISANTAAALKSLTFAETRIAATPDQDALLACL
ncbi:MAG TPA: uroporphyrinogen-III synthase [Rhizomicrobium sp.]|jgi:uroporphyrinogen-III synthase|nr:uroporphyrinogen-III synthase [Rhizomicrobium sp.]